MSIFGEFIKELIGYDRSGETLVTNDVIDLYFTLSDLRDQAPLRPHEREAHGFGDPYGGHQAGNQHRAAPEGKMVR